MAVAVLRPKSLAKGTLPTTYATLYTAGPAPSDGSAKVLANITLCNTGGAAVTVVITVAGGTSILNGFTLPGNDTYIHPKPVMLNGGEVIAGSASAASVHYIIDGLEASDT